MILKYKIDQEITVKDYLKHKLTSNLIKLLNNSDSYIVNDEHVFNYYLMHQGDTLKVIVPVTKTDVVSTKGDLDIIYEDDYLLIVNKPNNMATIPTRKYYKESLANIVRYYFIMKGINTGIHFINRLDYATSGIVLIGKNIYVVEAMKNNILDKYYLALLEGTNIESGEIITGIKKREDSIIKREIVEGTNAKTSFEVLKEIDGNTLVQAKLHTGKTHQLRLHFLSINHPIVGDALYNENYKENQLLMLHSYKIRFIHPITNEVMEFSKEADWI